MAKTPLYWDWVREECDKIGSDGCTLVSEMFHKCCSQHDLAYYWGKNPKSAYNYYITTVAPDNEACWRYADPVTRKEADDQFKTCIQGCSVFKRFSPLSYIRWAGVRIGGAGIWARHRSKR